MEVLRQKTYFQPFPSPLTTMLSYVFVTGNSAKFVRVHLTRVGLSIQYKERSHTQSMLTQ